MKPRKCLVQSKHTTKQEEREGGREGREREGESNKEGKFMKTESSPRNEGTVHISPASKFFLSSLNTEKDAAPPPLGLPRQHLQE